MLPVLKDEVIAFVASLDDRTTISFSGGDDQVTPKDWFLGYLAKQPKVVMFGEMELPASPFDIRSKRTTGQKVPDGYTAARGDDDLFFAAQAVAKEKGISFADAVDLVIEGRA